MATGDGPALSGWMSKPCQACGERPQVVLWGNRLLCGRCFLKRRRGA
jgi:ribosomal protein S27AE